MLNCLFWERTADIHAKHAKLCVLRIPCAFEVPALGRRDREEQVFLHVQVYTFLDAYRRR
jgi:hypothetical protein